MTPSPAILVGPLTVDIYLHEHLRLPGGGAVNMAYHWAAAGRPVTLIGRHGDDDAAVFQRFAARHGITLSPDARVEGASASIDIEFRPDGQPWMDNFVEGVSADARLTDRELAPILAGTPTHLVLVDVVDRELHRWAAESSLADARLSADFLDFRHMSIDRFRATATHLDLAFVGWPGDENDPQVAALAAAAQEIGMVLVVTLGARGVLVTDGRDGVTTRFPVEPRPVAGTTIGCGDAFIAAFLDTWYGSPDLDAAVDAGRAAGADATQWRRPLPESAYR